MLSLPPGLHQSPPGCEMNGSHANPSSGARCPPADALALLCEAVLPAGPCPGSERVGAQVSLWEWLLREWRGAQLCISWGGQPRHMYNKGGEVPHSAQSHGARSGVVAGGTAV